MNLHENAKAILLLAAHFTKPGKESAKPLTPTEWGRFALWLKEKRIAPADLLAPNSSTLLDDWQDDKITPARIAELLQRGNAMALALEKWSRAGIWVLTRSDANYPKRLKNQLKNAAPPVLFGCGNPNLLNNGGLAVVGSRDASDSDLSFTADLGRRAAHDGYTIVSGGARGVDETSMLGALEADGTAVGIVADSLLKASTAKKWRAALSSQNLALVSPFYPEAGFNTGNAMARNKYIYCMSDAAIVVHSGSSGGTWSGALENLKKRWVPLSVKPTDDKKAGNSKIVEKGAQWCADSVSRIQVSSLFNRSDNSDAPIQPPMPDATMATDEIEATSRDNPLPLDKASDPSSETEASDIARNADQRTSSSEPSTNDSSDGCVSLKCHDTETPVDFYQLFLIEMQRIASHEALNADQISGELGLHKQQVNTWIKRAVEEKHLKKLNKPVRYLCTMQPNLLRA